MDKLKLHSPDLTAQNIEKLAALFPNCVTEAADEKTGKLKRVIDFDQLRQELTDHVVDGPRERYHLDWPGKREALIEANAPIAKTLRPYPDESVNFEGTKNLFIEGDNLEALKLIQETYLGKVKLIYIDPPYNTGRNLIYKNDFSETERQFNIRTGQRDVDGATLVSNPQSHGRFHSDWLKMIYARLKISKSLLASDGVLICAIDENEFSALSLVLKEIYGEGGYEHSYVSVVHNPRGQQGDNFSYVNEYLIFVYPADKKKHLADFPKEEVDSRNLRDSGTESDRTDARNCFYPFLVKDGQIIGVGPVPDDKFHPESSNVTQPDGVIQVWPMTDEGDEKKWRYAHQSVNSIMSKLEAKSGRSSLQIIFNKDTGTMRSVWALSKYDSSEYGSKLLEKLIPGAGFTFPKSLWAVRDAIFSATSPHENHIIIDFFAGSGTTAHAVMQLNAEDGGNRRFIMVQIAQLTDPGSEAAKAGFDSIADISKERIRKAGAKLKAENATTAPNLDVGFRVLKVDSSNMKDVYYSPDAVKQNQLELLTDNLKEDRTPKDLLFQVLVDWGVDLALPITQETVAKKTVFFVDGNALAACFEPDISEELIKELASRRSHGQHIHRVVFRDSSFSNDSMKINAEQIFKLLSPGTELKSI